MHDAFFDFTAIRISRKVTSFIVFLFCLFGVPFFGEVGSTTTLAQQPLELPDCEPPMAKEKQKQFDTHGKIRIDEYFWLRERENPAVIEYLNLENSYYEAAMKPTEALQEKLFEELKGRIKQSDTSVPYMDRGYLYYARTEEGLQYPIYCRKKGNDQNAEEVMLDVNRLAEGHSYCSVRGVDVSSDNDILAYAVDTVGRRKYNLKFKNLQSGRILDDEIADVTGNIAWAEDNKTIFYTRQDPETLRSYLILKHQIGDDPANDKVVFEETDEEYGCSVYNSRSRKYIIIGSDQTLATECRYLDANKPNGEFTVFEPRERNHEYSIDHIGDHFVVRTNWNAKNFRLMSCSEGRTDRANWVSLVEPAEGEYIESFELFNEFLTIEKRREALSRIEVIDWKDGKLGDNRHELDFGEECYVAWIAATPESDTKLLRYGYSSMTTPDSTFDYDMATRKKTLLKQQPVLGGFDAENYRTERKWATARDGTKIPVSIVYHTKTKLDGTAPCLQYGYGSYGASMDSDFDSSRLSLLDRGFVYAIAHVRGGQELGRQWYEDGKLFKKKNTFYDFIDVGKFLVENKYADPARLYARGGSAGGLLMGAVINYAPELYHGVIADVPFVDVITTMLDDTIPLTTSEYDEWGNPNEQSYFDYMLSYSPYDNVEAKEYPHMLVTTGLHDSQVQYWEPAKWVARLRKLKTDDHLLIMKTNMDAGHGGASGRYDRYKETAFRYAFLLMLSGVDE